MSGPFGCGDPSTPPVTCGDGFLDVGEECDDGNGLNGDGCSSSCTIETGGGTAGCGNGILERGEICDGNCPTSCPQVDCNLFLLQGSDCTRECVSNGTQTACTDDDNCCPGTCNETNDNDCNSVCDNGVLEAGETCDPVSLCQSQSAACVSDANNIRTPTGNVADCTFVCTASPRPCQSGDSFCPSTCNATNDNDCPGCGNGSVESGLGETCDPPASCPTSGSCVSDADFIRTYTGDPSTCDALCTATPRPCQNGDGFCPSACDGSNDVECCGADTDGDGVGDGAGDLCDNCPGLSNPGQANTDLCADGGDACDNCDSVCNFGQDDSHGLRAASTTFVAPSGADCNEDVSFDGENDDLNLGDDQLSQVIDLEDEDGDGMVEGGETGDFTFTFFGKAIDEIRISSNGFVYLGASGELSGLTDSAPSAGLIPLFDGVDGIVAAVWTDLKASTHDPSGGNDPCVSFQIIGAGTSGSQSVEITWENVRLQNDANDNQLVSAQIRLFEADDSIEIHNSVTGGDPGDVQLVTRGVEGLFTLSALDSVGAAFLDFDDGNPSDDEVQRSFNPTGAVRYAAFPTPENNPNLESGDACDNATVVPECGDGFCNALAGETLVNCSADCFCGDGVCDTDEDVNLDGTCGFCSSDCGENCCDNAICEVGEDRFPSGGSPDFLCGTCVSDCGTTCCGDGICDPFGNNESSLDCGDCFCGDGVCDPSEDLSSCPVDCP